MHLRLEERVKQRFLLNIGHRLMVVVLLLLTATNLLSLLVHKHGQGLRLVELVTNHQVRTYILSHLLMLVKLILLPQFQMELLQKYVLFSSINLILMLLQITTPKQSLLVVQHLQITKLLCHHRVQIHSLHSFSMS
jgi:hypothetical protein